MKKFARRAAAAVLTLALLAAPVFAYAEPIGSSNLNLSDNTVYTYSTMNVVSDAGKSTNLHENIITYSKESMVRPVVAFGTTLYGTSAMNKTIKTLEEQGYSMVAGINGSFFDRSTGIPYGIVITNSILRSGGTANAVGFMADGTAIIGDPAVTVTLDYGGAQLALNYNKAMSTSNGVLLYSKDYDTRTKNTMAGYYVIVRPVGSRAAELRLGQTVTVEVIGMVEDTKSCVIPDDAFLLAIANDTVYQSALAALKGMVLGEQMTITVGCASGWENVMSACGGGDMLVLDGKTQSEFTLDSAKKMAARTAIGLKRDGSIIFYTCDEAGESEGITLAELADRMADLGCVTALNLDGGGSTAVGVTYPGYAAGATANVPSDGKLRECANFIFLVRQKQDAGNASKLYLYPNQGYVLPGAKLGFTVKAADSRYMAAAVPTDLTYSGSNASVEDGKTIVIDPNAASGWATVTASAAGLRATANYAVISEVTSIGVRQEGKSTSLKSLRVAGGSTTDLTAVAWYYGNSVYAGDSSFTWGVTGDIGTIDQNGTFTAVKTGTDVTGSIVVSYGSKRVAIAVTVGSSQPFADTKGHWAESYITSLYYDGTLQGSTKNGKLYYRPDDTMTRQEFIVAMMRYLGTDLTGYSSVELPFTDAARIASWAKSAMQAAYSLGYLTGSKEGSNLYAHPEQTISRQEAMVILSRTKDFTEADASVLNAFSDSSKIANWARTALAQMTQQKIIGGSNGKLNPTGKVTRAEVAKMLYMLANEA